MNLKKFRPPFKIHGGKYYLASWIIDHFPPNYEELSYIEPYVGSGSVYLNKLPSKSPLGEVINDIDLGIIQIYRAFRDEPGMFIGRLKRTKYCRETFNRALAKGKNPFKDYMEQAVAEFIIRRMSREGLGKSFAGSKDGPEIDAWRTLVADLPRVATRIENTYIFNKPATETLLAYDDENTLAYIDPPNVPDTRTGLEIYAHEMATDDHIKLWNALKSFRGKVIVSGQPSQMYKRMYSPENGWRCIKHKSKKPECIWLNY